MEIKTSNIGMVGEMQFVSMCYRYNLHCSKPLTDLSDYDFIVDNKNKLYKVQVKTITTTKNVGLGRKELWVLNMGDKCKKYFKNCDIIAVYFEPFDIFYLLDLKQMNIKNHYTFYPHKKESKGVLEHFKNAWTVFT